ncbi:Cytochrome P450 2D11 [Orchesella cincta]|uniref:Cytochrome P450 2D11 n=1 Tax=Orchesella cincta TaxID=48709 RepID=A0A1D2M6F1_ORCCI|nr:Cytochrome P450 2D11 [Orchesella cincta]
MESVNFTAVSGLFFAPFLRYIAPEKNLQAIVGDLFVAGSETSSNSLSVSLYLLELSTFGGDNHRKLRLSDGGAAR